MINITYNYLITITSRRLNGYRLGPKGLTRTRWGINHIRMGGRDINYRWFYVRGLPLTSNNSGVK